MYRRSRILIRGTRCLSGDFPSRLTRTHAFVASLTTRSGSDKSRARAPPLPCQTAGRGRLLTFAAHWGPMPSWPIRAPSSFSRSTLCACSPASSPRSRKSGVPGRRDPPARSASPARLLGNLLVGERHARQVPAHPEQVVRRQLHRDWRQRRGGGAVVQETREAVGRLHRCRRWDGSLYWAANGFLRPLLGCLAGLAAAL